MDRYERALTVRRTLGEKRERLARARGNGPACTFCLYGPDSGGAKGICSHIIHIDGEVDAVSGTFRAQSLVSTMKARSEDGFCGPEALLFEPRPLPVRAWRGAKPHLVSFAKEHPPAIAMLAVLTFLLVGALLGF